MARGGSRGGSRSPPPRSSSSSSRPMQPPPQRPPMQQTQTPSSGGMLSGIGSTIMTGMAFGAGSEIAHQAVRGLMGGSSSHGNQQQEVAQQQPQQQSQYQNPCQYEIQNFSSCLQTNDDVSFCQSYSDMLKQCKKSNNLIWDNTWMIWIFLE